MLLNTPSRPNKTTSKAEEVRDRVGAYMVAGNKRKKGTNTKTPPMTISLAQSHAAVGKKSRTRINKE